MTIDIENHYYWLTNIVYCLNLLKAVYYFWSQNKTKNSHISMIILTNNSLCESDIKICSYVLLYCKNNIYSTLQYIVMHNNAVYYFISFGMLYHWYAAVGIRAIFYSPLRSIATLKYPRNPKISWKYYQKISCIYVCYTRLFVYIF